METTPNTTTLEAALWRERNRLVRLCTQLTGDPMLAEDLAQETLLIAWQHEQQLRAKERRAQWMNGIARNLCHYWWRKQRTTAQLQPTDTAEELPNIPAAFDLEVELDRQELACLLDRALAQLPPLTRTVLIERYIHEAPQAEVAHQLHLSEGAVEARIHRGKLTLRRILTTELQEEAAALGLGIAVTDVWQKTRLWCPSCGEHYLQGRFQQNANHALMLCCPCGFNSCTRNVDGLFDNIHGYRAAMTRAAHWRHTYLQTGLQEGSLACLSCGQAVPLQLTTTPNLPPHFVALAPALPASHGLWAQCDRCQWLQQVDVEALASVFPVVQSFWRKHKRITTLPPRQVDYAGAPALVVGFHNQTASEQVDLFLHRQTLATLATHPR